MRFAARRSAFCSAASAGRSPLTKDQAARLVPGPVLVSQRITTRRSHCNEQTMFPVVKDAFDSGGLFRADVEVQIDDVSKSLNHEGERTIRGERRGVELALCSRATTNQ
jgi:hypothetical protein